MWGEEPGADDESVFQNAAKGERDLKTDGRSGVRVEGRIRPVEAEAERTLLHSEVDAVALCARETGRVGINCFVVAGETHARHAHALGTCPKAKDVGRRCSGG